MAFFWQKTRQYGKMMALEWSINYLINKKNLDPKYVEITSLDKGYTLKEIDGYYQIVREEENE